MGIRTGAQYLEGLRDGREVWMHGRRIEDVTTEPGLCRGAHTLADFLDRVHEPAHREKLSYAEAGSDERFSLSFLKPGSKEDVERRGAAFYEWAKWSGGMFGRTPDYKNASVMAFAAASEFLAGEGGRPEYAENMRRYYE